MSTYSLFYDWTERPSNSAPVTYVLDQLVQLIGTEVCTFKRNPHVSYQFVDTARILVNKINDLISLVETSPESNESAFELWCNAIEPLEDILLAFKANDDLSQDEAILDPDSVKLRINLWGENRKDARDALKKFNQEEHLKKLGVLPEESDPDLKAAYMHDDRSYLNDLVIKIKSRLTQDKLSVFPDKQHDRLYEILKEVSEVAVLFSQADNLPEGAEVVVIQSIMAVYGFLELGSNPQVSPKTQTYLISKAVCQEAKLLVGDIVELCEGNKQVNEVEAKYEAFLQLLVGEAGEEIPTSYYELMKQVAKIGCSYHTQSLLLVGFCRELVNHYQSLGDERNARHYVVIQNACDKTLEALKDTTEKLTTSAALFSLSNLSNFDAEKYKTHACTELFATTTTALKGLSDELGIVIGDVEKTYAKRLAKAVSRDIVRMVAARDRILKAKQSIPTDNDAELVDVTVNVRLTKGTGNDLGEIKAKVQRSALLSALGWGISHKSDLKGRMMGNVFKFELRVDGSSSEWRSVPGDKNVGSLVKDDQKTLELRMITCDPKTTVNGKVPSNSASN
ncbi:hypothetical protein FRC09_012458 [Ceratobasidium sp. 395]|nr:hypothetical protein FRC09_012458 [Ceratobasidium sp. 395]